ncbi:MAG TPA: hypothetical protein VKB88_03165 [Bryobacteraceae bacterium]|nr:hypothetical protein [Bryobacteraceae bacterium]
MIERECQMCQELLQAAQGAAVRHIDALSKLRMANMRFDHESIPPLQQAVEEARRVRERAMAVLREHFATHPGEALKESANG